MACPAIIVRAARCLSLAPCTADLTARPSTFASTSASCAAGQISMVGISPLPRSKCHCNSIGSSLKLPPVNCARRWDRLSLISHTLEHLERFVRDGYQVRRCYLLSCRQYSPGSRPRTSTLSSGSARFQFRASPRTQAAHPLELPRLTLSCCKSSRRRVGGSSSEPKAPRCALHSDYPCNLLTSPVYHLLAIESRLQSIRYGSLLLPKAERPLMLNLPSPAQLPDQWPHKYLRRTDQDVTSTPRKSRARWAVVSRCM
ncbi:hypothetical protein FKP32DRAFT_643667 [Trametes sanguinea]|nr:hypothetical protein FKP32DRAFT_643667 [Trametes sanguinea]